MQICQVSSSFPMSSNERSAVGICCCRQCRDSCGNSILLWQGLILSLIINNYQTISRCEDGQLSSVLTSEGISLPQVSKNLVAALPKEKTVPVWHRQRLQFESLSPGDIDNVTWSIVWARDSLEKLFLVMCIGYISALWTDSCFNSSARTMKSLKPVIIS